MKSGFPTEDTIRQYLLGRLDDQGELENSLSQQMLFDKELSEFVDMIEDQIIENYVDKTLNAADKKAVEEYFLRPPQRQEKLRFAQLLKDHFEGEARLQAEKKPEVRRESPPVHPDHAMGNVLALHLHSHFRTYCEFALLVLLTLSSLFYLDRIRHQLQSQIAESRKIQGQLEGQLAQERELSANLVRQVEELQPSVALSWSTFRDYGNIPEVEIRPFTQRIKVSIPGVPPGSYDVSLKPSAQEPIWSQIGVAPSSGILRVEIPAKGIVAGEYRLLIRSQSAHITNPPPYPLHVRVTK